MARALSRRVLARHIATQLIEGEKPSVLTAQLAAYLIEHRKTDQLDTIIRDIAHQLAEAGYVEATVTAAHELTKETEAAVAKLVKSATAAKSVTVTARVDESVLGGVRIETPGRTLDATIAHQLQTLKTRYKKA